MASQSFQIPTMTSRACVRAISTGIADVPGVRTVEACLATGTVRVTGTADPGAVQTAIRAAGTAHYRRQIRMSAGVGS